MQTLRHFVLFFIKKEANYYLVIFRDPKILSSSGLSLLRMLRMLESLTDLLQ